MDVRGVKLTVLASVQAAARVAFFVAILGAKYVACLQPEPDCSHAVRDANDGLAVVACEREYTQTRNPSIGARLANSLRRSGNLQAAAAIANGLLATPARSDAMQVLGKIAVTQNRIEDGRVSLEHARELHVAEGRPDQLAIDDQALAGIFARQKQFAEALRALDSCISESRTAKDRVVEGYCLMSAGTVLGMTGYFEGAQEEFTQSRAVLDMDRDLAALALERGGLDQRYGFGPLHQNYNAQAVTEFEAAIAHAQKAQLPRVQRGAELNLVYSLAELGRTDEAAKHLERARLLDLDNQDVDERTALQARIAYRHGDLALAVSLDTSVYPKLTDDDQKLDLCVMQGRIGLTTHDLDLAVTWATRGVELAEKMRATQSAIELRPWMLSMRRQPYEVLFTALARARRFEDALIAFDQWQGRTVLDAMARDSALQRSDLKTAAIHTETLRRLFPVLSTAPIMRTPSRANILKRLATIELVALLTAEDEVWRIVARDGKIEITDVGVLAVLQPQLDRYETTPTDTSIADALGTTLLGDAAFRETDETLFVLLDGGLSTIPIVSLRARGRPLIAMRPVVRPPRLSETDCTQPAKPSRHAVVIADSRGDLPAAQLEAREVAAELGVTPLVGTAATRDALFSAQKDDVLHLAVHASVDSGGGSLTMFDQPVSALEISGHPGPSLVVISACASAAADDAELATSLATAFVAGGSPQVIATLRAVTDIGAREVTTKFYRAGGVTDPVRTLAHVQASLATTANADWPNFAVFGHDVCRKESK
jgi:tetratricopeptide (TPR) repeat protein